MRCPVCDEPVAWAAGKYLLAFDRPIYMNVLFHANCYKEIEDLYLFITKNSDKLVQYGLEKGGDRSGKKTKSTIKKQN